ncbi:MAG: hypothetical protein U1E56_01385 [Bauldia sp.]
MTDPAPEPPKESLGARLMRPPNYGAGSGCLFSAISLILVIFGIPLFVIGDCVSQWNNVPR